MSSATPEAVAADKIESKTVSYIDALPHQLELWQNTEDNARIAMVGPYGCGKTMGLAIKAFLVAKDNRAINSMLVVPTYDMFRLIHKEEWPAIWKRLGVDVAWLAGDRAWQWPWGSKLFVRSAEIPERLAGPNLCAVFFDEPGQMSRLAWERGSVRHRHPDAAYRQVVLSGTPEGINWFADEFDNPEPPNITIRARGWHSSMKNEGARIFATYGYDDSLMAAYGRGEFVPLRQGRCYKHFKRSTHVVDEIELEQRLPLIVSCDFNVDSMRWEIGQIGKDWINIVDELKMGSDSTTEQAALEICSRFSDWVGPVIVTGDASGQARSTSGQVDYQIIDEVFRKYGNFRSVTTTLASCNPLHKARVDNANYHLAGMGKRVRVSAKCKDLIRDFERVAWKPGTTTTVSIDKKDSTLTHASDAATYMLWVLARVNSARDQVVQHSPARQTDIMEERW